MKHLFLQTSQISNTWRPTVLSLALAAALTPAVATPVNPDADRVDVTLEQSDSWVVPAGVTSIDVVLVGGGGGGGGGNGGDGGQVSSTLTVTPGETLNVIVGAGGAESLIGQTNIVVLGTGAARTQSSKAGEVGTTVRSPYINTNVSGSGGGASSLQRGSTLLMVAGGGGGSAFFTNLPVSGGHGCGLDAPSDGAFVGGSGGKDGVAGPGDTAPPVTDDAYPAGAGRKILAAHRGELRAGTCRASAG